MILADTVRLGVAVRFVTAVAISLTLFCVRPFNTSPPLVAPSVMVVQDVLVTTEQLLALSAGSRELFSSSLLTLFTFSLNRFNFLSRFYDFNRDRPLDQWWGTPLATSRRSSPPYLRG